VRCTAAQVGGDYVEVRAARAFITDLLFLKLAPASQCYAETGDEMTELGTQPNFSPLDSTPTT
jgi:hypothetical protein